MNSKIKMNKEESKTENNKNQKEEEKVETRKNKKNKKTKKQIIYEQTHIADSEFQPQDMWRDYKLNMASSIFQPKIAGFQ